jgi:predicted nucleotidyltransferase
MACNFSIPFTGSPSDVLARAKSAVQGQGGAFQGDEKQGAFELSVFGSKIRGSYTITGQDLDVTIESKPFILPCNTIESFLRSQMK